MELFISLLFLVVCTAFGAVLLSSTLSRFSSPALTAVVSWLVGHIAAAQIIYWLCILLTSLGVEDVLRKASTCFGVSAGMTVLACLIVAQPPLLRPVMHKIARCFWGVDLLILGVIVACAAFFYLPHLSQESGIIKTSPIYWDFNIHFSLLQSFVVGDNFPAQNPSMAGVPLTYHFFYDLLVSIYASLGADLVPAMNFVSIVSLSVMLLGVFGLSVEIFSSYAVGAVAVALVGTTASLRFLIDLQHIWKESVSGWVEWIVRRHPYQLGLLDSNTAGYNGNMFNLFYFLAERQLTVATAFLLMMSGILLYRAKLSRFETMRIGIVAGLFVNWHLFATISVIAMLVCLCCWGPGKKQALGILVCMLVCVAWEGAHTWEVLRSGIFLPKTLEYPKLNLGFSTIKGRFGEDVYSLSLLHFLFYWVFAYGIKLVLLPWALLSTWRRSPEAARVLLCWIIPTFILVNLIQLSPLSVHDNHKWLRPMNVAIDVLIASYVIVLGRCGSRLRSLVTTGTLMGLLTVSGIIENIPYARLSLQRASVLTFATRRTPITSTIESSTPKDAVFYGVNVLEVHMAGRKTFLSNKADERGATNIIESFGLDEAPRKKIISRIYNAASLEELCRYASEHGIDFIERSSEAPPISIYPVGAEWPGITGTNRRNHQISFLDIARICAQQDSLPTQPWQEQRIGDIPSLRDADVTEISLSREMVLPPKGGESVPFHGASAIGRELFVGGRFYSEGLGTKAPTRFAYQVPEGAAYFRAIVGFDDASKRCEASSARVVIQDEKAQVLFDSGLFSERDGPQLIGIDVAGKKELRFSLNDGGDGYTCDYLDIGDPEFLSVAARKRS